MFPQNCWYVVANREDVTATEPYACQVAGKDIVLYRNQDNKVIAMLDQCCHRLAPLSLGRIEGNDIRCLYHGIKFAEDGQCKEVPGQDNVPKTFCIKTFAIAERYEWIWIWIGDQDNVDTNLLPDTSGQNPVEWSIKKDWLDYAANYQLLNDNLCDLSHVAYVHETTLGALSGQESWAKYKSVITHLERGVRFDRWFTGQTITTPDGQSVTSDLWITYDYLLPGILLMDTGFYPPGTAEETSFAKPEGITPLSRSRSSQAVTPKDEYTLRYFFSIQTPHNEPNAILDINWEVTKAAFMEDKRMIEAQHQIIEKNPDARLAATTHDEASVYFRSLVKKASELHTD